MSALYRKRAPANKSGAEKPSSRLESHKVELLPLGSMSSRHLKMAKGEAHAGGAQVPPWEMGRESRVGSPERAANGQAARCGEGAGPGPALGEALRPVSQI